MQPVDAPEAPSTEELRGMFLLSLKTALTAPENRCQEAVELAESYARWCVERGFTLAQIEEVKDEAGTWFQAIEVDNSGGD